MKIIRDNDSGIGMFMIALLVDWNIRRCNFKNCTDKPNTIISDPDRDLIFGLCEEHYQRGNVPGGCEMNLEFNSFNAFDYSREYARGG